MSNQRLIPDNAWICLSLLIDSTVIRQTTSARWWRELACERSWRGQDRWCCTATVFENEPCRNQHENKALFWYLGSDTHAGTCLHVCIAVWNALTLRNSVLQPYLHCARPSLYLPAFANALIDRNISLVMLAMGAYLVLVIWTTPPPTKCRHDASEEAGFNILNYFNPQSDLSCRLEL